MSARRNKIRVSRLFHARLHGKFIWRSAEDIEWDRIAPVGVEFGSPDYERLMQEDFDKREGIFAPPDLLVQEQDSVTRLKGVFAAPQGRALSVEDMNPWKKSDKKGR
jgi:hypothetical protein